MVVKKIRRAASPRPTTRTISWANTILNDVTARDLQRKDGQWARAKGFDTFAPIGPIITDEVDAASLRIETLLNGATVQSSNTGKLLFSLGQVFEFITRFMTLRPGDVIATGTPEGVGPHVQRGHGRSAHRGDRRAAQYSGRRSLKQAERKRSGTMDCIGVNADGWLEIGGVSTQYLAEKYGTPLYVMDEAQIRGNCRAYREAFEKYYGGRGRAVYACKALCCTEICRIVAEEGFALDVVSGGEIYTAKQAGVDLKNAFFHGNNKTSAELFMALDLGVGCIVVDNAVELETLADLARDMGKSVDIMFRIKPGVEAHTHEFIRTGGIDSKFGVALENGEAFALLEKAAAYEHLHIIGLECHIGSQIFDTEPFCPCRAGHALLYERGAGKAGPPSGDSRSRRRLRHPLHRCGQPSRPRRLYSDYDRYRKGYLPKTRHGTAFPAHWTGAAALWATRA